jgi:hypothetical protein
MSGLNLIDHSCVLIWPPHPWHSVVAFVKGIFVDEQKYRTELVEIFCVRTVGGLTELILIHVVARCSVKGI